MLRPFGNAVVGPAFASFSSVHSRSVPIRAMTKELRDQKQGGLVRAIAQGRSVALWARDNDVPRSTAYRWACQPQVRASAESCRRLAQDSALGKTANRAYWTCYRVATFARDAESESVRLRALRSVLSGANAMTKLPVLSRRLAAINEELDESTENAGLVQCQNTDNTPVPRS
jgi:hypothetical protein